MSPSSSADSASPHPSESIQAQIPPSTPVSSSSPSSPSPSLSFSSLSSPAASPSSSSSNDEGPEVRAPRAYRRPLSAHFSLPPPSLSSPPEHALLLSFSPLSGKWASKKVSVQREERPFARGSCRLAHHLKGVTWDMIRGTEEEGQGAKERGSKKENKRKGKKAKESKKKKTKDDEEDVPPPSIESIFSSFSRHEKESLAHMQAHISLLVARYRQLIAENEERALSDAEKEMRAYDPLQAEGSDASDAAPSSPAASSSSSSCPSAHSSASSPASFVCKVAIDPFESPFSFFSDVLTQTAARIYAYIFNARCAAALSSASAPSLHFIHSCVLHFFSRPSRPFSFSSVEPFLYGPYTKYNNNNGYTGGALPNPLAQCFSHFSLSFSLPSSPPGAASLLPYSLLVVDIQGLSSVYTDPQIQSEGSKGWGAGNLGKRGMALFVRNHRCNEWCKRMGLDEVTEGMIGTEREENERREEMMERLKGTGGRPPPSLYKSSSFAAQQMSGEKDAKGERREKDPLLPSEKPASCASCCAIS